MDTDEQLEVRRSPRKPKPVDRLNLDEKVIDDYSDQEAELEQPRLEGEHEDAVSIESSEESHMADVESKESSYIENEHSDSDGANEELSDASESSESSDSDVSRSKSEEVVIYILAMSI